MIHLNKIAAYFVVIWSGLSLMSQGISLKIEHKKGSIMKYILVSSSDEEIFSYKLPGRNVSSIEFIPVLMGGDQKILELLNYPDNPAEGLSLLKKDKSFTGEFDLKYFIKDFESVIKNSDVLLIWIYTFKPEKSGHEQRLKGCVLIRGSYGL